MRRKEDTTLTLRFFFGIPPGPWPEYPGRSRTPRKHSAGRSGKSRTPGRPAGHIYRWVSRDRPGPPGRRPASGLYPRGGGRRGRHRFLCRPARAGRERRGPRGDAEGFAAVACQGERPLPARARALRDRGGAAADRHGAEPAGRHALDHGGGAPLQCARGGGCRGGSDRPGGGKAADARRGGDGGAGAGVVARRRWEGAAGWGGGHGGGQPLACHNRPGPGWGRGGSEMACSGAALPGREAGGVGSGVGGRGLERKAP